MCEDSTSCKRCKYGYFFSELRKQCIKRGTPEQNCTKGCLECSNDNSSCQYCNPFTVASENETTTCDCSFNYAVFESLN
jgi:hypothetical protein